MRFLKKLILLVVFMFFVAVIGGVGVISWLFELSIGEALGLIVIIGIAFALTKK